jgi:hypothetical protein
MTTQPFKSANGLKFLVGESDGCGVWECRECGQKGYISLGDEDRLDERTEAAAIEHSHVCPAQRGKTPENGE